MNTKIFYKNEWWYSFGAKYMYDNIEYELEFYARNKLEAQKRIQAMKATMEYGDQIVEQIEIEDISLN